MMSKIFVEEARMDIQLLNDNTSDFNKNDFLMNKNFIDKKILFVTRLSSQKQNAISLILESIKKLSKSRDDFILYIVAFSETRVNQILFEKKIDEINFLIGRQAIIYLKNHSSNVYKEFDIIIGVARVCFEAMINAKPVILVGENGCSGIIDVQDKTHFYQLVRTNFSSRNIKPIKNVDHIINCLNQLIDNSDYASKCALNNKKWVEKKMDARLLIKTHQKIYNDLFNKSQKVFPLYNVFYMIIIKWVALIINSVKYFFLNFKSYFI